MPNIAPCIFSHMLSPFISTMQARKTAAAMRIIAVFWRLTAGENSRFSSCCGACFFLVEALFDCAGFFF